MRERVQNYGTHQRPEDYLDSFNDFIKNQLNQSAALGVVVNRPKDLTRAQLISWSSPLFRPISTVKSRYPQYGWRAEDFWLRTPLQGCDLQVVSP